MSSSLPPSRSSSPVRRTPSLSSHPKREVLIVEDDDTVGSLPLQSPKNTFELIADSLVDCIITHGVHPIKEGLKTTRDQWRILLIGQVLSVLIAGQGASQSSLYLDCHLSAPTFATGLVYLVLIIHLLPLMCRAARSNYEKQDSQDGDGLIVQGGEQTSTSLSSTNTGSSGNHCSVARNGSNDDWWWRRMTMMLPLQTGAPAWSYFGIALLDVEANYLIVSSFRFTSLTSASVLDAMAIPSAMVFSRLCLRRRYRLVHLLGVSACLCGMTANVFCDFKSQVDDSNNESREAKEYPHLVFGDFLAILGGLMFGARDVLTENFVRHNEGTREYLGMIGLFGTLISILQVSLLERKDVADFFHATDETCPKQMGLSLLLTYVLTTAARYVGQAHFLQVSEAALLNLSLLTGDLWSALFEIVAERIVPPSLFWVSLVLIVGGVFVYEIGGSPIVVAEPTDLYLSEVSGDVEIIEFVKSEDDSELVGKAWKMT